ncbi:MAG: SDR family NAD(P)-dependent oxidoreductase, partial [Pedobacter sp.]
MNISNKTILITGGGSGIGYEIARQLSEKGNNIIIVGRTAGKLAEAAASLQNTTAITVDVNSEQDVTNLVKQISERFPSLSVLINNAGRAFMYTHSEASDSFEKAKQEMETNYFA